MAGTRLSHRTKCVAFVDAYVMQWLLTAVAIIGTGIVAFLLGFALGFSQGRLAVLEGETP